MQGSLGNEMQIHGTRIFLLGGENSKTMNKGFIGFWGQHPKNNYSTLTILGRRQPNKGGFEALMTHLDFYSRYVAKIIIVKFHRQI